MVDPEGLSGRGAAIGGTIGGGIGSVLGGILGGGGGAIVCSPTGPGALACGAVGGAEGAAAGGIAGAGIGAAIGNAIEDYCKDKKPCPPCRTVSGKIVPVGTVGYRPLDIIADDVRQHGVFGSHHNIFVAKQNPNNCQCFWQKQKFVLKPGQLGSAIPIEAFAN